jgi:hypothetical protein
MFGGFEERSIQLTAAHERKVYTVKVLRNRPLRILILFQFHATQ